MNPKNKSAPLIISVVVLLVLIAGFFVYRSVSRKNEGRSEVTKLVPEVDKAKQELLKDYSDRLAALVAWSDAIAKDPKKASPALKLNETILRSSDLKFETQAEAERFDFVQNQVSEMISKYIAKDPGSTHMREIQKIEESLNRHRREYSKVSFRIEDLNHEYRVHDVTPVIFPAERVLKEHDAKK